MGSILLFGLCTCLLVVSGITADDDDDSYLNQFLKCAQHVGNVESPQDMKGVCDDLESAYSCAEDLWKSSGYDCSEQLKPGANAGDTCRLQDKETFAMLNKTADPCTVLKEAINCIEGLWNGCGYDCTKKYKDYNFVHNYKCYVHDFIDTSPMNANLELKEHPCVVLQNLKDCLPNCPGGNPPDGYFTDYERPLDQRVLPIADIRATRECSQNNIDEHMKKYDSNETNYLNSQTCKELKVSMDTFMTKLKQHGCMGSTVQIMVVDVIGNGALRYLKQCEERECSETIVAKYIEGYNYTKNQNMYGSDKSSDCDTCTTTKNNMQHIIDDIEENTPTSTCEGTTLQRTTIDIVKVGMQHKYDQCDAKCEASCISNPLVAICLLIIAYVFNV